MTILLFVRLHKLEDNRTMNNFTRVELSLDEHLLCERSII